MPDQNEKIKALLTPLRQVQYNYDPINVQTELNKLFHLEAVVHLAYPFEDLNGATGLYEQAYQSLHQAWPDLERYDYIVIAGTTEHGVHRVGCCGYYTGKFIWQVPNKARSFAGNRDYIFGQDES